MMIREADFNEFDRSMFDGRNIIYGAGYNGKKLLEKLLALGVSIDAFYDDDPTRQGKEYEGLRVLEREELCASDRENTNILISSMYAPQMAQKAVALGFSKLYAFIDFLLQRDGEQLKLDEYRRDQNYIARLRRLMTKFDDAESLKYLETVSESVIQGKALRAIADICSSEPQYFLKSVRHLINGINFVDAGAYTGDTLRELAALGLKPANIYAFEADEDNFQKLKTFRCDTIGVGHLHLENYALWSERTRVGMKLNNFNAAVDPTVKEKTVETMTIDEYFDEIPIGFIKIDIEGAERHALAGGMNVLKRDRPVLAISIYHGLNDVVDIPTMLISEFDRYDWRIRKHSATYSEAIMYGVPKEKIR